MNKYEQPDFSIHIVFILHVCIVLTSYVSHFWRNFGKIKTYKNFKCLKTGEKEK